ncbi:UDP-N-acetylmuramoyl-L-alanine--D-glutamate ligase [Nakamurella sp. YIM 132087]|uniref:UDP-N-acetylmuramoylalanine--D-glutamate ligase n=1 Tax=Nakamurella alba TaxID=2665158 RepID=A0A7K1FNP9_9ACTN|nr:UDP-N-acetylmuramoyl-L-alanine--D-glutamate ligase [Nakamurella alba]MTD14853.1 UDP-N-acetylmuramoyl-L-alanine--D-glutamate ligase [Nakamurella alba]
MRPPISWSDLADLRVGVYGLGTEGRANLRACDVRGLHPVLVDDRPPATTADDPDLDGRVVLATESGGQAALLLCDVVIKSPGVPAYGPVVRELEAAGVLVAGGLGLWLMEAPREKVLCITGSKGKSTTTSIAGHLLSGLGYRTFVGGNLGSPPQDPRAAGEYDRYVIEVSSYQATDLPVSPPVVAVTSLSPDHLPWHGGDPETYFADKLSLATNPGVRTVIANGEDVLLATRPELQTGHTRWVRSTDDPDATWMQPLGLLGAHNRLNAMVARECLRALDVPEADDAAALERAAAGFAGLESRLHIVGDVGGVTFVDDGLSTNVLPVLAAVDSFPDRRVALLVGGQSRGIDYRPLATGLRRRTLPLAVFTMPDNGPDIAAALGTEGAGDTVTVEATASLAEAVARAYEWAAPDGVVLLSPAAPSFGRFKDYRDRGRAFVAAMESLRT